MLGSISIVESCLALVGVLSSLLPSMSFSSEFESSVLSLSKNPSSGVDGWVVDESSGFAGGSGRTDDVGWGETSLVLSMKNASSF